SKQNFDIGKYLKGDKTIWFLVLLLSVVSLLVVYSSTAAIASRASSVGPLFFFAKQLMFLALGFGLIFVLARTPYTLFMGASKITYYVSVGLLVAMFIVGQSHNQAIRSLFFFQPAELCKIALIMYVAHQLTVKQDCIKDFRRGFLPVLVPILLTCLLIFLSNFSTSIILGITCLIMMFIGRVRISQLLITSGVLGVVLAMAVSFTKIVVDAADDRREHKQKVTGMLATCENIIQKTRLETIYSRIDKKLNDDHNIQAEYSYLAIASSGLIIGKGPGNSTLRYSLPEAFSDFVFAIVVEEYGVLLSSILILCYLIILYRAGVMMHKAKHFFPALLAVGIGIQITQQALVNMFVATGMFPVTGQNLPFISQGGTSILTTSIMLGMLLSVSRSLEAKAAPVPLEAVAAQEIVEADGGSDRQRYDGEPLQRAGQTLP
ncbi:MAG: FtsW/RodA/SpoVE family cell cycle protein, partial [Prevotellaceae bacterium]|nr:FtsW/RodA/SpoVE family cell cycle protein [Prevotellaceae bacterium]